VSVDGLAADWGISERAVLNMCGKWELPVITPEPAGRSYVSLYALERALFEVGVPQTLRGDSSLVRAHMELAGCLYGTITKELIRERCLELARALNKGPARRKPGRPRKA
jgi:hypothetical protein